MASIEDRIGSLEKSNQALYNSIQVLQSTMLDGFATLKRTIGPAAAATTDGDPSDGGPVSAEDTKQIYAKLMNFVDGGDGDGPSQSDVDPVR